MVDDTACAGTADKTILAPVLTSPVATQATRLKRILPERLARFQADCFEVREGIFFTAEGAGVRRGRGRRSRKNLRRQYRGWTGMYADRIGVGNRRDSCPLDVRSGDRARCFEAFTTI